MEVYSIILAAIGILTFIQLTVLTFIIFLKGFKHSCYKCPLLKEESTSTTYHYRVEPVGGDAVVAVEPNDLYQGQSEEDIAVKPSSGWYSAIEEVNPIPEEGVSSPTTEKKTEISQQTKLTIPRPTTKPPEAPVRNESTTKTESNGNNMPNEYSTPLTLLRKAQLEASVEQPPNEYSLPLSPKSKQEENITEEPNEYSAPLSPVSKGQTSLMREKLESVLNPAPASQVKPKVAMKPPKWKQTPSE